MTTPPRPPRREPEKKELQMPEQSAQTGRLFAYLKTGELIEMVFPDYDVRYIAINDGVDTFKSENELMVFKNIFNDWYARDTSKKIRAVNRDMLSNVTQ